MAYLLKVLSVTAYTQMDNLGEIGKLTREPHLLRVALGAPNTPGFSAFVRAFAPDSSSCLPFFSEMALMYGPSKHF